MSRLVFPFEDPVARDVGRAGGKAARLAEMTRVGIRVPPGFVVGTDAWRAFLRQSGRGQRVRTVLEGLNEHSPAAVVAEAARELQRLLIEAAPPTGLPEEVEGAYARLSASLGSVDSPVAVRSSATVEDASDRSFAGQYETYLWIRGAEAVLRSIQLCWASSFGASGLAYALGRGPSTLAGGMGVVVQAMVRARTSGVMFTCDPTTGDPSTISIEGSFGLGSAVVGGEVTPDQFTVAKPTMPIRDRQIRRKEVQHLPVDGGGTRVEAVAGSAAERPCLGDQEVLELAKIGRDLERLYGGPQDVEWSIDESLPFPQNVFILQCRPETAWSGRKSEPVLDPDAGALGWITQSLTKGA
jgi:pyruvate, water dikinase